MNQLTKVFEGQQLRVIEKDNETWFVAKDVAKILHFTDAEAMTRYLDSDEKQNLQLVGFKRGAIAINESGLYSVILKSRKQEAKDFKRWVTHDVIPSIRKTGSYTIQIPKTLPEALRAYANEVESHERTMKALETAQPKAEYFDALVERKLLTNFRDTAKELHIGQKKFVEWLIESGYVYRDQKKKLKPYMKYVPDLFELKEWERNGKADVQTLVTPKGKETFRLLVG
ncbi:phage antirepressor KilAC domain-containing protein [Oceanobacillus kimchii]|uniref:phage antirepressor KilAC domain-containing protein n=1 Tax=Oceanobacillus kimchii TaxID=746691 RepID=UPI00232E8FEC|nr:phage antirepressor KilAC domain-containing protein [Oceanobacillus kimchii]